MAHWDEIDDIAKKFLKKILLSEKKVQHRQFRKRTIY